MIYVNEKSEKIVILVIILFNWRHNFEFEAYFIGQIQCCDVMTWWEKKNYLIETKD